MADVEILPAWATVPSDLKRAIDSQLEFKSVPITKELVIDSLYTEAKDRSSKSQSSRLMAWKMICELKGYLTPEVDNEEKDEVVEATPETIKLVVSELTENY